MRVVSGVPLSFLCRLGLNFDEDVTSHLTIVSVFERVPARRLRRAVLFIRSTRRAYLPPGGETLWTEGPPTLSKSLASTPRGTRIPRLRLPPFTLYAASATLRHCRPPLQAPPPAQGSPRGLARPRLPSYTTRRARSHALAT